MEQKLKQRICIEICLKLQISATETFEMLNKAFPNDAPKRTTVFEWHSRFKAGRISIEDDPRQGRPKFQRTDENVQKITDLIKENPRTTLLELEQDTGISKTTIGRIVTEDLKLKKTPAKFIPRFLTNEQKLEIGSRVGRNQTTVMRICDRWMQEVTTDRRVRSPPQCTTSRADRQIVRMAVTDRSVTSRTVAQHIQSVTPHTVSARTIRRRLQQSDGSRVCSWKITSNNGQAARAFLEMHRRDGDQLFSCIVTGDESWVHHSTQETKRQIMVRKRPKESAPKKAKVTISAGKVMAIVFWDCKSVLLVNYLPPNTTVNAARYCEVLTKLRAAIKRKRPGLLSRKVLLVHDNARPHTARTTHTLLENFKWEISTHPPYSPELTPSDFHLFPALKLHLGGKHFANDDEVQAEANHWLPRQDTALYNNGIKKLLQRYQKCLDRN
ncbi:hypothetical protein LAZ67_10001205, partial [Cordylochernes scorpioides]